jgi:hypothetical protein
MEFPNLQLTMAITATLAVRSNPALFPGYACLRADEGGKRTFDVDGGGFMPFCLRNKDGYRIDLQGLFLEAPAG